MPTIAVIIPNYNHGHLIEKSILSTFQQSVPPDEIIVVDDGSTDDSVTRLIKLEKEISILKLVLCEKNQGTLRAGTLGVQNAKSDILMFRAADDILPPDSIKHGRDAFEKYPRSKIAFGEILFFRENTSEGTVETLALSEETEFFPADSLLRLWKPDFNLPEPACFVKKSAFLEQGGLWEEAKWYSGWLCFTSIAFKHGLTFIPEVLNSFRLDANSYGTANLRNRKVQRDVLRFLIEQVMSFDRELKEKFFACGAFTIFGEPLKDLLAEEKQSLPANSNLLFKSVLPQDYLGEGLPQHGIPGVVTRRLQELVNQLAFLKDLPSPKIIIYGAGTQSLILLEIWNRLSLPTLSAIVVSQTEGRTEFHDLPIIEIDSLKGSHIDLFILSSKSFELEMAAKLDKLFPSSNRLSFWAKELTCLTIENG
jgi:glycosyltransferase involved in cell wall biosynthesis